MYCHQNPWLESVWVTCDPLFFLSLQWGVNYVSWVGRTLLPPDKSSTESTELNSTVRRDVDAPARLTCGCCYCCTMHCYVPLCFVEFARWRHRRRSLPSPRLRVHLVFLLQVFPDESLSSATSSRAFVKGDDKPLRHQVLVMHFLKLRLDDLQ